MAKRTIITLIDDLDGTDIPPGTGETVRFGVDGRSYEIDLGDDNAAALRAALQPYAQVGRRLVTTSYHRRRR
ncbi:Lsr2 family protein [Plantibacter sp. VKM Ac-2880]|uniref:histone-like nucleoid-structuring protein Lsr2 n=1 Tax=Plantibacter sp. VKM Ac-2880 TaxID=2783827 RepID=UPI00188F59E7|nr:Lsr2 family protein [Plantibacter sp. VKM Ac-2880]MBF4568764.1 Lsr2 family protein [Plantibacter sp. VKM Ac-2880]